MSETLNRLIRKRGALRGLATRLIQKIEIALQTEIVPDALQELLDQVDAKETLIVELNEAIEEQIRDLDQLEIEVKTAQEYQDYLIVWKGRANRAINRQNSSRGSDREESRGEGAGRAVSTMKLPRLSLDRYNGEPSKWQSFWSQFDSAVHGNRNLTKTEKLGYLMSFLGGTAHNAISGLAITDENYDTAITILTERFGRKELVVNAHMTKLLNLKPVKNSSDVKELRHLFDICSVQVRSLEAMGVVTESYGSLLCPILMRVIPSDITLEFDRRRESNTQWNVKECLNFLQREVEMRERAATLNKMETSNESKGGGRNFEAGSNGQKKQTSFNYASTTTLKTIVDLCIYCEKTNDHKPEECSKLSVKEKRDKLQKDRRCFSCLDFKHISRYCRSKARCLNCGRKHHTSICEENLADDKESSNNVDTSEKVNLISTALHSCETSDPTGNTVLLQTARTLVEGTNGNANVRSLLDSGSQRTFIRKDIADNLGLQVVGQESLSLHSFECETSSLTIFGRVKAKLSNLWCKTKCIEIEALVTPSVSSALIYVPNDGIQETMDQRGLRLADADVNIEKGDTSIGLLIGSDYYWDVVTGRIERLREGLVALETIFGWCIQGPTPVSVLSIGEASISIMKIVATVSYEKAICKQLQQFGELSSLEIKDTVKTQRAEDEVAIHPFQPNVELKNRREKVELPRKPTCATLQENLVIHGRRFKALRKRFKSDQTLFAHYQTVTADNNERGIIQCSSDVSTLKGDCKSYFLQHYTENNEVKGTSCLCTRYKSCKLLNGSLYVDNYILSTDNDNNAFKVTSEAKDQNCKHECKEMGYNFRRT